MDLRNQILALITVATLVACGGDDFSALRSPQSSFNAQQGSADAEVSALINWTFDCTLNQGSESTEVASVGGRTEVSGLGPFKLADNYNAAEISFGGEICLPSIIPAHEDVLVLFDAGEAMAESDPFKEGASCGRQNILSKIESVLAEEPAHSKGRRIGLGVFTDLLWRKTAGLFASSEESLLALNYRKTDAAEERFCASAPGAADWEAIAAETSKFFASFAAKQAKRRLIIITSEDGASSGIEAFRDAFGADFVKVVALDSSSGFSAQVGDPIFEVMSAASSEDVEAIGTELFPKANRITVEGRGIARPTQQWTPILDTDEEGTATRYSLPEDVVSVPAAWGYELRVRSYDDSGKVLNDQLGLVGWP